VRLDHPARIHRAAGAWIDGRARSAAGSLFVPFFDEKLLINELTLRRTRPLLEAARLQTGAASARLWNDAPWWGS
jgi:hypothetical protein